MNSIERRALYHLLRVNWLNDPELMVEPWQVADYRSLPLETLFEKLKQLSIQLDQVSFIAHADECDSPEELTEYLIGDQSLKVDTEDHIYLVLFELWRRLMGEKPSLSILCNELDNQIHLYDQGELKNPLELQEALASFIVILDENVDEGLAPKEAFQLLSAYCANDIQTFLYDFISEQLDEENDSYAHDILDDFADYLEGNKWFDLLRARLIGHSNSKLAHKLLSQIIEDYQAENDLEFSFELLACLAEISDIQTFKQTLLHALGLVQTEEDFQDLLNICLDYFHRLDNERSEKVIESILHKRSTFVPKQVIDPKDPDLKLLGKLVES